MATRDSQTVGIIGDGQLGMMLCEAAAALPLRTVLLAGSADCPAALLADQVIVGAMDDAQAIARLMDACDVITYEREDVPATSLEQLQAAVQGDGLHCYPPPANLTLLQDKARQKQFYADRGLATLPFVIVDGSPQAQSQAVERLGLPLVQKTLRGGFDGRGVQLLRDRDALADAWPGPTLYEQFAGQFTEVAVLMARSRDGALCHFGPVDMSFEDSHAVLDTVSAPSTQPEAIQQQAVALARDAVTALEGVGVYGVEMFVLEGGRLVINEISPRVHNAGHYSLRACATSQFEQHLRAVTGLPFGDASLQQPAAMRNILSTPPLQQAGRTEARGRRMDSQHEAELYWYGKSPARAMRKLGHITALGDSSAEALSRVNATWTDIQDQAGEAL